MTDGEERAYEDGRRAGLVSLLAQLLRELGVDDPDRARAAWIVEKEQVRAALRSVCEDHGDNDWDDDLHLADVVNKHLGNHLG